MIEARYFRSDGLLSALHSGGSRNFERGSAGWLAHTQRTAEGGAQSCEVVIIPCEARKKIFYVFFLRSGSALIASLCILDTFPDAKKID